MLAGVKAFPKQQQLATTVIALTFCRLAGSSCWSPFLWSGYKFFWIPLSFHLLYCRGVYFAFGFNPAQQLLYTQEV